MEEKEIEAQGVFDIVKAIKSIDLDKIKKILDTIEVDEDGWLRIKIDLRVKS